jgi:DNA repair protein RadC
MQITLMRLELQEQPVVNSWDKLIDYCNAQVAHNTVEEFTSCSSTARMC